MNANSHRQEKPCGALTLSDYERYANELFAQELPKVLDMAEDDEPDFITTLFARLDSTALKSGLEICKRGAYLLSLALYDEYLQQHAEELHVPAEYFDGARPEDEARAYLNERRLGVTARHVYTDAVPC